MIKKFLTNWVPIRSVRISTHPMGKKKTNQIKKNPSYLESPSSSLSALNSIKPGVYRLSCSVQPGCSQTQLTAVDEDLVRIRLGAPPVDGEANQELIKFLSKSLNIRKSDISLIQGHKSKQKVVEIFSENTNTDSLLLKLKQLL